MLFAVITFGEGLRNTQKVHTFHGPQPAPQEIRWNWFEKFIRLEQGFHRKADLVYCLEKRHIVGEMDSH